MKNIILFCEGMNEDFLYFLDELNLIPHLSSLLNEGSKGTINNSHPNEHTVSYTSFLTGQNPAETGYFGYVQWNDEIKHPEDNIVNTIDRLWMRPEFYPTIPLDTIFGDKKTLTLGGYHNFPANFSSNPTISTIPTRIVDGFNTPILLTSAIEGEEYTNSGMLIGTRIGNLRGSSVLKGPDNTTANIKIEVFPDEERCVVSCRKSSVDVRAGELSKPLTIFFKSKTRNILAYTQVYLLSITPHFQLFFTPLSFHAGKQYYQLTKSKRVGRRLEKFIGPLILSDCRGVVRAYDEGMVDMPGVLSFLTDQLGEYERLMVELLEYDYPGLDDIHNIIVNIPVLDALTHTTGPIGELENPLTEIYRRFDWFLGWIQSRMEADDKLNIVSDTGHSDYKTNISINKLFYDERSLVLDSVDKIPYRGLTDFWKLVDWHQTCAFSMGGGKVFINRHHREIKDGRNYEREVEKLINFLSTITLDSDNPFSDIRRKREVLTGQYFEDAPDLLLTLKDGYVNTYTDAWTIPRETAMKNDTRWRYEHITKTSPGFVLSTMKGLFRGEYSMEDVGRVIGGVS